MVEIGYFCGGPLLEFGGGVEGMEISGTVECEADHVFGEAVLDFIFSWHKATPECADGVVGQAHGEAFADEFFLGSGLDGGVHGGE